MKIFPLPIKQLIKMLSTLLYKYITIKKKLLTAVLILVFNNIQYMWL